MIIKSMTKPEDRKKYSIVLGGVAQLALILGIILGRLESPHPALDFISGMLMGSSIVGNLAYLVIISRNWSQK